MGGKRISNQEKVLIGGKICYKLCKCGEEKEKPSSPFCRPCNRKYLSERKSIKINDKLFNSNFCIEEDKLKPSEFRIILINFVNKIERRGGLASLQDVYVDLITLYNYFGINDKSINILEPAEQLSAMWQFIKERKKEIESDKQHKTT